MGGRLGRQQTDRLTRRRQPGRFIGVRPTGVLLALPALVPALVLILFPALGKRIAREPFAAYAWLGHPKEVHLGAINAGLTTAPPTGLVKPVN